MRRDQGAPQIQAGAGPVLASALVIALALTAGVAQALAEVVIQPPDGLWIRGTGPTTAGKLYGASNASAQWHVAQWGSPSPDLSPFEPFPCPPTRCTSTSNDSIDVSTTIGAENTLHYVLQQQTQSLPCLTTEGHTREFDLLVGSNNERNYPAYRSAMSAPTVLGSLSELRHRITVRPVAFEAWPQCERNQAQLITALVMRNDAVEPKQIFFYQLRLFQAPEENVAFWWWPGSELRDTQGLATLVRFGFGDNVSSFQEREAALDEVRQYDLDLLPRLRELIASGAHGIDRNLANWYVTATYHGQAVWGGVRLGSEWSGFELTAEVPD